MHKIIAYIALLCGAYAIAALAYAYHPVFYSVLGTDPTDPYAQQCGLSLMGLVFVSAVMATLAMILGAVSRFISHRKGLAHALPAKLGIFLGAIIFVILAGMSLLSR